MVGIIIGIVFIGVGIFLFISRKKQLSRVLNIKYFQTTTAKKIFEMYEEIKSSLGQGSYNELVELSGIAQSDQPILAEYSKKEVVYCHTRVVREYETRVQRRDSKGNLYYRNQRSKETLSENKQHIPFYLEDNSGEKILIDMESAKKYTQKVVDRFEKEPNPMITGLLGSRLTGSRTFGYRITEEIIPIGAKLYVLGEASDRRGELCVLAPQDKKNDFIVSTKSEEELVGEMEKTAKTFLIIAYALGILGVSGIIWGIISLIK